MTQQSRRRGFESPPHTATGADFRAIEATSGVQMTPEARRALEAAWLRVLGDLHPGVRWELERDRPDVPDPSRAREIVGAFAAPEDAHPLAEAG